MGSNPTPSANMNDDELDLDGDGVADVVVPGLAAAVPATVESSTTAPYAAIVAADMPPESSPYSPMGQIEHMGYALRSETARTGWRHQVIRSFAIAFLVFLVAAVVANVVANVVVALR